MVLTNFSFQSFQLISWATKIILPLKKELRGQVKSLAPRFHDLQPSLLLFLHRLRRITVVDKVSFWPLAFVDWFELLSFLFCS